MRTVTLLVSLGIALGASLGFADPNLPDRHPVLLRKTQLLPPLESAGTGLAPEVKVKVEIDRRGIVSSVEVVSVEPSSELDEVFKARTVEELKIWRWAPAIENGEPKEASLAWTVQFKPQEGSSSNAPPGGSTVPLPDAVGLRDAFDRRRYLRDVPLAKKKTILSGYSKIAEKYLVREKRRQFDSPRFIVVTDADHEDTARIVAQNLEAAYQYVEAVHRPHIEPLPHELRTLVYLYRTRAAFEAMRGELLPFSQQKGTYYSPGLITYSLEVPSSDYLLAFLIHEASHAYSDHHMRRPAVDFPTWFEEGFAEYMGNSRVKKGKLEPGRTQVRRYTMDIGHFGASRPRLAKTVAGWDLDTVKQHARKGKGMTIRELLAASREDFYADFPIHYGTAWLFVHFLRHGQEEWEDGRFSSFVLYLTEGYSDVEALREIYGLTLDEIEEPFRLYVQNF